MARIREALRAINTPMRFLLLWLLLIPRTALGLPALEVDPDSSDQLSPLERARIGKVIQINQSLLGAEEREYCPQSELPCLESVTAEAAPNTIEALRVESIWPEQQAGSEWPTRIRPTNSRRVQVRADWRKGQGAASRSLALLLFSLPRAKSKTDCVFPLEHWEWSGMARPERFAMAPRGICGDREISVTDLFPSLEPRQPVWAIRFLSLEEGRKWISGSVEALRRPGTWNAGHGYAKFFFLHSMRWWRGGGTKPSPRYAAAVRLIELPLDDLQRLSANNDAFLNFYEDGAQIELTVVSREGLAQVLQWPMELLIDTSEPDARGPKLQAAPATRTALPDS